MPTDGQSESGKILPHSPFPQTLWTVVLEAAQGSTESSQAALRKLCVLYREPVRVWLLSKGTRPEEVDDAIQGFIEHLLQANRLRNLKRQEDKFRSFLLECLVRYLRGVWRKEKAAKRGGDAEHVDFDDVPVGAPVDFDKQLDLQIALATHRQAMDRLRLDLYGAEPKQARFFRLKSFIWGSEEGLSYEAIGGELGMTAGHVKKFVFDLRHHYYDCFRGEVAETVTPPQVDEETRYLMTLLAESGGPG
jgi:DNA-directed RNA polymerase specialized sigma24 family protein